MRILTLLSYTLITCFLNNKIHGQFDFDKQLKKVEHNSDIIDPIYGITIYEPFNLLLTLRLFLRYQRHFIFFAFDMPILVV